MANEEKFIKAADFLPVLDQVIGFVTEALQAYDAATVKVAELQSQLASKDKVILEKVAAANAPREPVFNDEEVIKTLNRLQEMRIIDQEMATKFASDIKADHHLILPLLTRISEALISTAP